MTPLKLVLPVTLAGAAGAQPINLDLNDFFGTPGADFGAAADQPGHWNVARDYTTMELADLAGIPCGVMLSQPQGLGWFSHVNSPFLEGDLHALLEDGIETTDDKVHTLRFESLAEGAYDLYVYTAPVVAPTMYEVTSGDQFLFFMLDGGWNGDFQEGKNYARRIIDVTDGVVNIDFVGAAYELTGWTTGVQLVPTGECLADVNGDGKLNILDFVAFQTLFTSGDLAADCNGDGALNILDFVCFQLLFQEGCS